MHLSCSRVRHLISEKLGAFLISDPSEVEDVSRERDLFAIFDIEEKWYSDSGTHADAGFSDDVQTIRCGIYLPPRFHLLIKFRVCKNSTLVRIHTDCWQILSEVDAYFEKWMKEELTN